VKSERPSREDGFALVVAVIGVAIFAYFAFEILDASWGAMALVQAEQDRATLSAAAEAGFAKTLYSLTLEDRGQRLPIDGHPRVSEFYGVKLVITVSDERGKVAINREGPEVARRLFAAAGVSGQQLDVLVQSLEDWKDEDDTPRPLGGETAYYIGLGYKPRNGSLRSVGELGQIRDMNAEILARVAPAITLYPSYEHGFDPATAPLLALQAMQGESASAFDVQKRQMELAGERTAIEIAEDQPLAGRVLSIAVACELGDRAALQRRWIVEFTGNAAEPYWVRALL
jgi:general secretion pathway protein K